MTIIQKVLYRVFGIKPKPKEPLRPSGVKRGENPEFDFFNFPYRP